MIGFNILARFPAERAFSLRFDGVPPTESTGDSCDDNPVMAETVARLDLPGLVGVSSLTLSFGRDSSAVLTGNFCGFPIGVEGVIGES